MKKHILLGGLSILLFISQVQAQTQQLLDSLMLNLKEARVDSIKVDAMLSLSAVWRHSEPKKAVDFANKALELSKKIPYPKGHAAALFNLGAIRSGQSDYKTAINFYGEALTIAEKGGLKREPVQYKLNIGIIYDITGEASKAMEIYNEVLNDSRAIKDTVLETSAFQNMAILHIYQGELQKAKDYFIKAIRVVEQIDHPEMMGQITNNLASVYGHLYEFDSARYWYERSMEIWKKRNNEYQVARNMYNMAIDELETGSGSEAERLWRNSLEIREKLGDTRGVGLCQSALGSYYSQRGDYSKAVDYFQQSLRSFEASGLKREIVSTGTNLGLALHRMGDPQSARERLLTSLKLGEEIQDPGGIANALFHLGVVDLELGNMQLAAQRLDRSTAIFEKTQNWEGVGKGLHQRGNVAMALGSEKTALDYYQRSWQTLSKVFPFHEKLSEVYNTTSRYYLKENKLQEAAKYQQLALQALIPDNRDSGLASVVHNAISLKGLLAVLLTQAQIHESEGALTAALQDYQICFQVVDSLQSGFRPESQQLLIENAHEIYDGALEVLAQLLSQQEDPERLDQILSVMEGYKSFLLNQAVMRTQALEFAGVPRELVLREEALKNRIGFLKQKLWDERATGTDKDLSPLEAKLFLEESRYDSFKSRLQNEHPDYYNLRYSRAIPTVRYIKENVLTNDQALVEYFMGKDHLFALAISQKGENLISIPYTRELAANLAAFYQLSSKRTAIEDYQGEVRRYAESAYELYRDLLLPLESVIQDQNLIIIPDGELHYITFSALLTEKPQNLSFAKLPYLIRKVNTSYYYSAGLLGASLQAKSREQLKSMLALTPEEPGPQEFENLMAFRDGASAELGRIPGAYYEVINIGELVGADFFTGAEVSESNFKRIATDYKVLHLAMHGVVDNEHPNFSRLVFNSQQDTLNDGLLHTYELYNMQLNADLVVLSACNTGYGTLRKGEGLLSLGRSFAYAGCPNILMSRWPAADQPTNELMQYFYAHIKDGIPKDEALRQAKLQYLGSGDMITTHPVYWANFVLVGNSQPLELDRSHWTTWLVLAGLLILILGFLLINMRKKRRLAAAVEGKNDGGEINKNE